MKRPENAKCVFNGILFKIYQWKQEMPDGSHEIFESVSRKDTVQLIAAVDDKIIILKESQPCMDTLLSLPGGQMEEKEDYIAAAKRELLEETGHTASSFTLWKKEYILPKVDWNFYYVIAHDAQKMREKKPDKGEKIDILLVSFEEFIKLVEMPEFSSKQPSCL